MPEVKISALPAAGALDGTETFPVVQGGVTKRTTGLAPASHLTDAAAHSGTFARVKEGPLSLLDSRVNADNTGATDTTAALVAARNLLTTADGGKIFGPPGRYRFTSLVIDRAMTIEGVGGDTQNAGAFGAATWASDIETGTIFESTATSGFAFDHQPAGIQPFNLRHVMVKGIGDATRTTGGVRTGTAVNPQGRERWEGVSIVNFATGLDLGFHQDSVFVGLEMHGCTTGLSLHDNTNQNTFVQIDLKSCVNGISLAAGTSLNEFISGAIQGITGTGVLMAGAAHKLFGLYMENTNAVRALDITGGSGHSIDACLFGTANDGIRVGANACVFNRAFFPSAGTPLQILAGVLSTVLINSDPSGTLTDGGSGTVRLGAAVSGSYGALMDYIGPGPAGFLTVASVLKASKVIASVESAYAAVAANEIALTTVSGGGPAEVRSGSNKDIVETPRGTQVAMWQPAGLAFYDGMNIIIDPTTGTSLGTTAAQKTGMHGARTVQGAANPDTAGATLAALETEVNELKALLRSKGLMAP